MNKAAIYFPNDILLTPSARDLITVMRRRDCVWAAQTRPAHQLIKLTKLAGVGQQGTALTVRMGTRERAGGANEYSATLLPTAI